MPCICNTYLQCTIVACFTPTLFCLTLKTKSRKSEGSSGTPWSGHAMYCICNTLRCSRVYKQEERKYKIVKSCNYYKHRDRLYIPIYTLCSLLIFQKYFGYIFVIVILSLQLSMIMYSNAVILNF